SREGWCEQIASSLVVLARANGLPARLVTGFVPSERDAVTGTYVVRAKDAHAWAEVWFEGLGWVPFDPTADVPLAATDRSDRSWGRWLIDHALVIGLVLAAAFAVGRPLLALVRRRLRQRQERPVTWAARTDAELVRLGERAGRARHDGETATAYGRALADRYGDGRLAEVGRAIDDGLFAPEPPGPERRQAVGEVLREVAAADVPPGPAVGPEPVGAVADRQ
ncbi:MAG TPA: transglutaminase family protein, partial [Aquihabitans sp.]|nr:transglutaminase family protein [Aquihabitans sp.]